MISRKIEHHFFQILINLSFITRNGEHWLVHDVVSKSIRQSIKDYAPKRYYELKQRALDFYDLQEHINDLDTANYLLHRIYLCEDDFAREIFFSMGLNLEQERLSISPASAGELPNIPDIWKASIMAAGFPENKLDKAYEDTMRLVKYCAPYIRMLRDASGNILGYHATVPLCALTFDYFAYSPATRQYLTSLPSKELSKLRIANEQTTDTYFIRHFDPNDMNNPLVLGALLQDLCLCCMRDGIRTITTIPLPIFREIVEGLGFRKVPGIFDVSLDLQWPTYELDFRHTSIRLWYQWLALGRTLPHWLHLLLTSSKDFWQRQVDLILDNLDNHDYLNHHPVTPLAEAIIPPAATSGEPALKSMVLDQINRMEKSDLHARKYGRGSRSWSQLLKVTFTQKQTREQAANSLNLPLTTYYRRLKQARLALANDMYQSALQTAQTKYTTNPALLKQPHLSDIR